MPCIAVIKYLLFGKVNLFLLETQLLKLYLRVDSAQTINSLYTNSLRLYTFRIFLL
jgi:hypothetical protein